MRKYSMEFIGTFFLVLVIGLVVSNPQIGVLAPLAIGAILMAMVYTGGHISGGHYNPAVTIAVYLRGKCPLFDVPFYILAQFLAATVAALVLNQIRGGITMIPANIDLANAFIVEVIFTFILVFVVLNVATAKKTEGNMYFGAAIGFTVIAGSYAVGNISGGVFNPAVALGITIMGLSHLSYLAMFFMANISGGILASLVFKMLNGED